MLMIKTNFLMICIPKNVDDKDEFFDDLYGKYNIQRVSAKRRINSKGDKRNNVNELLISNF